MTTETVKELTRSIAEATEGDAAKAAAFDALVDEFAALIAACKTSGRLLGYNSGPLDRASAALASARRLKGGQP